MKDRKEWIALVFCICHIEFHVVIFAWPCILLDCPPVLWRLSPGDRWDGMPLHDAVGVSDAKQKKTRWFFLIKTFFF